jgi:hypothetical protein
MIPYQALFFRLKSPQNVWGNDRGKEDQKYCDILIKRMARQETVITALSLGIWEVSIASDPHQNQRRFRYRKGGDGDTLTFTLFS